MRGWKHFTGVLLAAGLLVISFDTGPAQAEALMRYRQDAALLCLEEAAETDQESVPEPLEKLSLYATAAVLMDADSGRVLFSRRGNEVMAMASTTKIMTCIIALENGKLDDEVSVSAYAAGMPKVKLSVKKGETYVLRDLLFSLMLESHNDSAVVIAEHIGKSMLPAELREKPVAEYTTEESRRAVAAFARLMNQKASELSCKNTWFITPNGLDATENITLPDGKAVMKEHSTTATELARIMSYCIRKSPQRERFLEITRTPSYRFSANQRDFQCSNHNAFLNMMDGALSGKTGFTNKAGYCYVGSLERDGRTFVVTLLACGWPNNKTYKWSDTRELMEYGLAHYSYHDFSEKAFDADALASIPVADGQTDQIGETASTALAVVESGRPGELSGLLLREDEEIVVSYQVEKALEAPVRTGEIVGEVAYQVNGRVYKTQLITAKDTVEEIDFAWCAEQVLDRYLLPGAGKER